MTEIDYISNRGSRVMTREGDLVTEQFPGDKRRFVLVRPVGKKLKFELPGTALEQRRDDDSKWTETGRIVEIRGLVVEDECPDCGAATGTLTRTDVEVSETNPPEWTDRVSEPYMTQHGGWSVQCSDCGQEHDPKTTPDEPAWPEPGTDDEAELLRDVQAYAEHVNEEMFNGEINLDSVRWEWNSRNSSVAGRAWGHKVQLTPQYLEQHGWNEFLKVVRHELIHVWENHAGDERSGHSAQFHNKLIEANTRRHCKHF